MRSGGINTPACAAVMQTFGTVVDYGVQVIVTMEETRIGMRVAFIGLGVMGAAMAANLARKGFAPVVFNRTATKAAPLVALGAKQAETGA